MFGPADGSCAIGFVKDDGVRVVGRRLEEEDGECGGVVDNDGDKLQDFDLNELARGVVGKVQLGPEEDGEGPHEVSPKPQAKTETSAAEQTAFA